MDSKLQYQPYAIAYLDILGFKEFVRESETDEGKRKKLDSLFNEVIPRQISTEENNGIFPALLDMKCLSASDSIVISVPVDHKCSSSYSALTAVSIKSIQITHELLIMGFLVRGAIAVGNAYLTDSNIVGTGYQEAVKGEKTATYPQILLTESATANLYDYVSQQGWKFAIYAQNEQGQVILDTIYPGHPSYWRDTSGEERDSAKYEKEAVDRFKMYRSTIIENLSLDDLKAREKWTWFARLFNANVSYFPQLRSHDLEIKTESGFTMNFLNPPEESLDWLKDFTAPVVKATINKDLSNKR